MIERIEAMPAGTLGLRASGKLTVEDYREVLEPALEEAMAAGSVRLAFVLTEFAGSPRRCGPSPGWPPARSGPSTSISSRRRRGAGRRLSLSLGPTRTGGRSGACAGLRTRKLVARGLQGDRRVLTQSACRFVVPHYNCAYQRTIPNRPTHRRVQGWPRSSVFSWRRSRSSPA